MCLNQLEAALESHHWSQFHVCINKLDQDPRPGPGKKDPELRHVSCSVWKRGQKDFFITQTIAF